jgi:ethanolamine kinase
MGTVPLPSDSVTHIPLYYDSANSRQSALKLILTLRPEWRETQDTIEFVKFTDGITNTVRPWRIGEQRWQQC